MSVFNVWQCCSQGPVAKLRTLAAAPALQPPPRSIGLTSRSVQMEWDEPLAPNGIIERCVEKVWDGMGGVRRYSHPNSSRCLPAVSCIWDHLAPSPSSLFLSPVLRGQQKSASLVKGKVTMWQVSLLCKALIRIWWYLTHQQKNSMQPFTQHFALN